MRHTGRAKRCEGSSWRVRPEMRADMPLSVLGFLRAGRRSEASAVLAKHSKTVRIAPMGDGMFERVLEELLDVLEEVAMKDM